MPCYERRTIKIDMPKADPSTVRGALDALGFETASEAGRVFATKDGDRVATFTPGAGFTVYRSDLFDGAEFRRAYSAQAVKSAARQLGWKTTAKGASKFVLTRRAY